MDENKNCNVIMNKYINKLLKYALIGIVVSLVAKWVSSQKLENNEIAIIALSASTMFIILDIYSPSIKIDFANINNTINNIGNKEIDNDKLTDDNKIKIA